MVSNIISHIIQFEATFSMTSKENPHCGLNVAAVTIVTNPCNPHRSHIWKTWNQKPFCGLNVAFIIHIIWIIYSSDLNLDYVYYVGYWSHKLSRLKPHLIHISLPRYVQFFHSAIWCAAYPTGHHLYINIHFSTTLILWKFLSLILSGFGQKWKFKYLSIPF